MSDSANETDFRLGLVEHLSREIDGLTQNMGQFRARIAFSIFLGPFILLGSLLLSTKDATFAAVRTDSLFISEAIIGVGAFIGLGFMAAIIERHMWDQANQWRKVIARLSKRANTDMEEIELTFRHKLIRCYVIAFILIILAFVCTTLIVIHLRTSAPPSVFRSSAFM